MHAELAREHDRQPGHEERDRDDAEHRDEGDAPALADARQEADADEHAAEQGAHADEGGGQDFEGGEGVALVAAAALERDGGGGLTAAEVLEFGVRKGGDDAGDEGNPRRAPVEEDEDQPEIPDGFHVMLG